MPSQFPPYSSTRHSAIEARRSSRGPPSRDGRYRHSGEHQYRHSGEQQYRQQHYVQQTNHRQGALKTMRGHFNATVGEFIGTTMFLFFALAGTQSSATLTANTDLAALNVMYVSLVFGLSLLVCAWAFYRISGGLFNPAVTLGLAATGQMPLVRALFVFPAQILGGMAAAGLVSCMFPNSIAETITLLSNGTSTVRGLFIEAFGTFILVFTILMLAVEKNYARSMAPIGIGLALFIGELAGVPYTGGSYNPARSLGPSVAARSFPQYHWIYWIGPFLGALVAALYHRMLKFLSYEEAQPGQDAPHGEAQYRMEKRERHQVSQQQYQV